MASCSLPDASQTLFQCLRCPKTFESTDACCKHFRKKHGQTQWRGPSAYCQQVARTPEALGYASQYGY